MLTRVFIAVLVAVTVVLGVGYQRGGRPLPVYTTTGTFVRLLADDQALFWLEKSKPATPGAALYMLKDSSRRPTPLYRENRLAEAVAEPNVVFALQRTGETGAVIAVPRQGGRPTRLATGLVHPAGLAVAGGRIYWTETVPGRLHHVLHVPAVQGRTILRSLPVRGGRPRVVAVWEEDADRFPGQLLGVYGDRFYWLDRFGGAGSEGWSAVRRVAVNGGVPRRLVLNRSRVNEAVLDGKRLFFTAPSEDAGRPLAFRCVRQLDLSCSAVVPHTLTDWLPPTGKLVRSEGRMYSGSLEGLWRVPAALARPLPVGESGFGSPLLVRHHGALYFVGPTTGGFAIYRFPLTFGGRLLAAFHTGRSRRKVAEGL